MKLLMPKHAETVIYGISNTIYLKTKNNSKQELHGRLLFFCALSRTDVSDYTKINGIKPCCYRIVTKKDLHCKPTGVTM